MLYVSDYYAKIFICCMKKAYADKMYREEKSSKRQKLNKLVIFGTDVIYTDAELARVSVLRRNLSRQQCACHLWQASGKYHEKF